MTEHELLQDCEGIPLAIGALSDDAAIYAQVAGGLQLIAEYAPPEFARIRSLMRGIVVAPLYGARGEWRPSLRACAISMRFLKSTEASSASVAATVIHELAHARLDALGFDYREERRARIERICYRRSQRFLESLPASEERAIALEEVEGGLSLDSSAWSVAASDEMRRRQPWYVRLLRFLLVRLPSLLHPDAPT